MRRGNEAEAAIQGYSLDKARIVCLKECINNRRLLKELGEMRRMIRGKDDDGEEGGMYQKEIFWQESDS